MGNDRREAKMFFVLVGFGFMLWGIFDIVQIWYVRARGADCSALVVRTWHERTTNFTYHKSGDPKTDYTNMVELALLEDAIKPISTTDSTISEQAMNGDNYKEELGNRLKNTHKRIDSMLQSINNSIKPIDVPKNAPKYAQKVPDEEYKRLYSGKKINAKRVGKRVWLEYEYKSAWPEAGVILLAIGAFLVVLTFSFSVLYKKYLSK